MGCRIPPNPRPGRVRMRYSVEDRPIGFEAVGPFLQLAQCCPEPNFWESHSVYPNQRASRELV